MSEDTTQRVIWQIESTHPQLVEPLDAALRQVVDPEIGLNIIELGLVREVELNDSQAKLTMIMTTPFCPYAPALLEMTRQAAENALAIPTTIEMGVEMWDFSMMEEGVGADWGLF